MARIPLINPQLVKVVAARAESTPAPILRAEVISSEPIKASPSQNESQDKKIASNEQNYKVVLQIGKQQIETIGTENFKKGRQLEVKVAPGPELKIVTNPNDKAQPSQPPVLQATTKAALQQVLADRIPNIQLQGLAKLVDQLSLLMSGAKSSAANKPIATNKTGTSTAESVAPSPNFQKTKQALANLAYQSLVNQTLLMDQKPNSKEAMIDIKEQQSIIPMQKVKNWIKQLPSSSDISNSKGLRNALNNTGVHAETQLSQLAQQFASLNKGLQGTLASQNSVTDKSANNIFQQLQQIQQKIFSKNPESPSKTDLGNIIKNTAQSLEKVSQAIPSNLKTVQTVAQSNPLNQAASSWQNPLLNNPGYSTLTELLNDPLLQNPSSNNKFALSQILSHFAHQTGTAVKIPLNWPERSGNDAVFLRTLQNLLGHIEREQSIQLQQSDSNAANSPITTPQNQQWLPLLFHHHQQLQLVEFFIDKEEKNNAQGEKKNHWFINLHFDLPKLGELGIEISMFENECNTTFWSESSSTLSQITYHVKPLRERLTEQGIIVSDVQSRHGTLSKRKHNIEQHLVDVKT
jgi:hypothetical protein